MLISFEDIRKGDRIRVTLKFEDITSTFEGVAKHLIDSGDRWATATYKGLAVRGTNYASIELLERQAPELPTEPGSVITNVVSTQGVEYGAMFLDYQGDWEAVVLPNKLAFRWLLPSEIKSFRLAKVVPADD